MFKAVEISTAFLFLVYIDFTVCTFLIIEIIYKAREKQEINIHFHATMYTLYWR